MIAVILLFIILAGIHTALALWGHKANKKDMWKGEVRIWYGWIFTSIDVLFAVILFLGCFRWQVGTDIRTGYIYSVDEEFGKGMVHIRLSENAGTDSQEPFCVRGENLEKARALAGSGKKVRVTIPSTGIRFENDYFACTSEPIIEEVEDGNLEK